MPVPRLSHRGVAYRVGIRYFLASSPEELNTSPQKECTSVSEKRSRNVRTSPKDTRKAYRTNITNSMVQTVLTLSEPRSRFGDKTTHILRDLSPKRDCGPERVNAGLPTALR